ncbi:MAG: dockerin type I domain-containing protein [Pirellulales bacterium]
MRSALCRSRGDANNDGRVDGLDFLVWASNFDDNPADDPPGSPANGDFNDDGVVDGADYLLWAAHFGETGLPSPLATATVPNQRPFLSYGGRWPPGVCVATAGLAAPASEPRLGHQSRRSNGFA